MKNKSKKNIGIFAVGVGLLVSFSSYKVDFFEIAKQLEIYNTVFKEINMGYVDETNPAELMENGVKHMLETLDPYNVYSSEQDVENAKMFRSGRYASIGVGLKFRDQKLIVTEVFKGSSADLEGIVVGDEVVEIEGISTTEGGANIELLIGGKKNSTVSVTYSRDGQKKTVSLRREITKQKAVPLYDILENNIGYIALDQFSKNASNEVESALKFLLIDEVKGLILDLRNNPGGILQEAVNIVNLFVPKDQVVVSTKSNVKQYNTQFLTRKQPLSLDIPLVVLINENSASASEIVAGALQDLDRAVIVGQRSFGKGLVQQSKPLPYGGQIKVTISRYYTPSGRCIQALDYTENLESGVVRKVSSSEKSNFKTKNGRVVYDGGGVLPDLIVGDYDELGVYNVLKQNNIIFDFVAKNYKSGALKNINQFKLNPSVFKDFQAFCLTKDFELNTKTELFLNKSLAAAKDENLMSLKTVATEVRKILRDQKKQAINGVKDRILWGISEEIIQREFYREGVYQYALTKHPTIQKGKSILTNLSDYYKVLK